MAADPGGYRSRTIVASCIPPSAKMYLDLAWRSSSHCRFLHGYALAVRVEVARRVRKGWFQDQASTVHFIMRVGGKPLELQPGKAAISIGSLDKLPGTIDALISAVRAGELDPQIKEAAAARGLMMAERRRKAA
ncbi:hypothetical protein [Methylorubrum extorquens]